MDSIVSSYNIGITQVAEIQVSNLLVSFIVGGFVLLQW